SRRDPVGLVIETFRKDLSQILNSRRAKQPGVNRRHTVGAVRTHDCQVGHADLSPALLLDQAYALKTSFVSWKTASYLIQQAPIDLVDDFEVAGQHDFKPRQRPFLEGFRQQRVVG